MRAERDDKFVRAMAAVRKLHSPRTFIGDGYSYKVCCECRQSWPCTTEQAIAVELNAVS